MTGRLRASWMLVLGVLVWQPAEAQLVQAPPDSTRGILGSGRGTDGAPQMDLSVQFSGGYDDNILPLGWVLPPEQQDLFPIQSGYASTLSVQSAYRRGRGTQYFRTQVGGTMNQFELGLTDTSTNRNRSARVLQGSAGLQGSTSLGRRFGLIVDASTTYEPANVLPTLGVLDRVQAPSAGAPETPPGPPVQGLINQQWFAAQGLASLSYRWTPRQSTHLEYLGVAREALDDTGYDTRSQAATLRHSWSLTSTAAVDVLYRDSRSSQMAPADRVLPFDAKAVEARLTLARRLSPTRDYSLVAGGGVVSTRARSFVDNTPFEFVAPILSAGIRVNLSRRWAGHIDARRDAMVLDGLSREIFAVYAVAGSLTGRMGSRLSVTANSAYTTGTVPGSGTGSFDWLMAGVHAQFGLGRRWALTAGYTHYDHQMVVASALHVFPATYTRNSFRVGFTTWLPLYGTF